MLSAPMQSAHLPQHSPLRSRSVLPSLFRLAAASPQSRQVRIHPPFRSVTFDLPEGWTVRSDEGVYTDSSYSDFGFNLHGRKLLYDENGNLAGAVGFHSYGAEGYAEYGYREAFAPFALGHVKYFDWDNYHFVDGDSSNCESVYSVSYHGISSAAWIDGWGFHPFYCPTAVSCCATGNPVSVAVELSNTYEDSASLSKRVAESIRFE